jgi:hypothetical protein
MCCDDQDAYVAEVAALIKNSPPEKLVPPPFQQGNPSTQGIPGGGDLYIKIEYIGTNKKLIRIYKDAILQLVNQIRRENPEARRVDDEMRPPCSDC